MRARGLDVDLRTPDAVAGSGARVAAVVLLEGELSAAGEHAEALVAAAVQAVRPGGLIVWTVSNAVHAALAGAGRNGVRAWSAEEAVRMAGLAGLQVDLVAAPGAAARVAGRAWAATADAALDRTPGLLDAGPLLLLAARSAPNPGSRSMRFFRSLPLKIVAAAAICQDARDRLLCVDDVFKGRWTIPGGIVDAGESPRDAAVREAREEAGVTVRGGDLLGIFALGLPDRLLVTYRAVAVEHVEHPTPLHPHEIARVAWLELDEAMRRFAPATRFHVGKSLGSPGGTWLE